MMSGFSLRARILLGAVLWTTGLFAVLGVIMTQIMFRHPSAPRVFHSFFAARATASRFWRSSA